MPIVRYLCEVQKVNTVTTSNDGKTPLEVAENEDIIDFLLPLHSAYQEGDLESVKDLCEVQKVDTESKDKEGKHHYMQRVKEVN